MELPGFEPRTLSLQRICATNCAIAPLENYLYINTIGFHDPFHSLQPHQSFRNRTICIICLSIITTSLDQSVVHSPIRKLVRPVGIEPTTRGLWDPCSHHWATSVLKIGTPDGGLNPWPPTYKAGALTTTELQEHLNSFTRHITTAIRRQELNPSWEHHHCSRGRLLYLL